VHERSEDATEEDSADAAGRSRSVSYTATMTQRDLIDNNMSVVRSSVFATATGTFGLALGIVGAVITGDVGSAVIPIAYGLVMVTGAFSVPFVWWAVRRRPDLLLAAHTVEADESGLTMSTNNAAGRQDWSVYRTGSETAHAFILGTGAGMSFLVPKRGGTAEQIDAFRQLLDDAGLLARPNEPSYSRRLAGVAIGLVAAAAVVAVPILLSQSTLLGG
jgi:tetrahydromethanopterin S-methyltransferase subunit F